MEGGRGQRCRRVPAPGQLVGGCRAPPPITRCEGSFHLARNSGLFFVLIFGCPTRVGKLCFGVCDDRMIGVLFFCCLHTSCRSYPRIRRCVSPLSTAVAALLPACCYDHTAGCGAGDAARTQDLLYFILCRLPCLKMFPCWSY